MNSNLQQAPAFVFKQQRMNIFLSEILTHLRDGQMSLPEVAQQLRTLGLNVEQVCVDLQQAANEKMIDEAAAEQLIDALRSKTDNSVAVGNSAPTLLRTIAAMEPESPTLVPQATGDNLMQFGTGSAPASHPKTDVMHDRLHAAFGTRRESAYPPLQVVPGAVIRERFVLKERIGQGGMGVVFSAIDRRKTEARDPNPLVAIKILDAELALYEKAWMALQREARKAQTLAHPNIVTVYDFDRDAGTAYMTMELLEGHSLESLVREARRNKPDPKLVMPVIIGMAEGLAYAHRNGIVHADLKPGNVFVTNDNVVKLLDFGIARAIPAFVEKQAVKDNFDAVALGAYTATYATAEMMQAADPDASDDVYGLALIAYELLTGYHPYQRQSAVDAQKNQLVPAPIKGLTHRQWRVLERSLRFSRRERPRDAGAFLRELNGYSRLQQALFAGLAVLALVAGFFAYQSYREAGPAIAFSSLPVSTQQQFNTYLSSGNELWDFYEREHNLMALQDAVDQYAKAYALHPRNRAATFALRRAADAGLKALASRPEEQRELAKMMSERSDYLASYEPVREALK